MKRVNGTGSVEELPDGRARIRIVAEGKRRQLGGIYPSRGEAQADLDAWLAANASGHITTPRGETLAHYGAAWLTARALGALRMDTHTHLDEPGTSLRAAGWVEDGLTDGGEHSRAGRRRAPAVDPRPKRRWWAPGSRLKDGREMTAHKGERSE